MKKKILRTVIIVIILSVCSVLGLTACSGDSGGSDSSDTNYTAEDLKYSSEADDLLVTIAGREYYKANAGIAVVGMVAVNGYTGPILVGNTSNAVAFYSSYSGKSSIFTSNTTVSYNSQTYYYSVNKHFMSGVVDRNTKTSIYYCESTTLEDAAIEMLKIADMSKFALPAISTVEELKALNNSSSAVMLGADINLSSESNWTPIEGFSGILIGNGHSITNLTINSVNGENIGLFGTLQGTVKDLTVENAQITARGDAGKAGIVAGTNKGTISHVIAGGNIAPEYYNYVGGLVGYNDSGKIVNCTNQATVIGADNVGGIAGSVVVNANDAVTSCVNEGMITGKNNVGGIAGYITCVMSNATYQISDNTNKNTVTGDNQVGGVFGEVYAFYQSYNYRGYDSYFSMSVLTNTAGINGSATGNNVGGLIGKASRLTILTACENSADITGGVCVGGFVGYAPDTNIKATGAKNNSTITGKGKIGGFAGQAGVIENAINNGEIVSTGVMVENGNSRAYVGGIAGYCTGLIGCENNIDIKIESNGDYVGGLAGYVIVSASNRVDNNINYGTVTGYNCVGGIVGYLTCIRSNATYQVTNNENKSAITGNSQVGGVFGEVYAFYQSYNYQGYNSYFSMSVLTNTAEINGSSTGNNVGGLIGKAARLTVLTACENTADITGGICVGGFVGYAPDTNIKATGVANNNTITGNYKVGGFAGQTGVIEYAVNSGEIIATGKDSDGQTFLGGIAGYCAGIIGCVNNTDISVSNDGNYVGGLVGYIMLSDTNAVYGNTNHGKIEGANYVGGIAGYVTCVRSNATYRLTDNENKNTVQGNEYVGGIAGCVYAFYQKYDYRDYNSYFEIVNSTNEAEIVGVSKVGGICGGYNRLKTDANLMDTNTTLYGEKLGQ